MNGRKRFIEGLRVPSVSQSRSPAPATWILYAVRRSEFRPVSLSECEFYEGGSARECEGELHTSSREVPSHSNARNWSFPVVVPCCQVNIVSCSVLQNIISCIITISANFLAVHQLISFHLHICPNSSKH